MNKILIIIILTFISFTSFAQKTPKPKVSKSDSLITISTQFGDIKLLLYEATPKHRSNFLKLVKQGFYNNLLFHRIIQEFMIQGGDPDSKNAQPGQMLGRGGLKYTVDAEFNPKFFHKRGALAAARDNNPRKASSSCQFYIVQGKKLNDRDIAEVENRYRFKYTDKQKEIYKTLGGAAFLDQNYTVFGEVISGMEVVDNIAAQTKDPNDRPQKDIQMNIKVQKMSKKKITKLYGYVYEP